MLFPLGASLLVFNLAVTSTCGEPCPVLTERQNIESVLRPTNVGTVIAAPLFLVNAKLVRSDADYRGGEKALRQFNTPKQNSFVKNKAKEKAIRRAHFRGLMRYFLVGGG
jgi:hypothetical protein